MAPVSIEPLSTSTSSLPLSEYIFRRILSLGIHSIFGVPGDYNLSLLEHIYSVPELNWIGCCNELNSAYAADGYSRTIGSNKFGVLLTTQGVGEMSAINGVSGSFAEHVPILHIVGTTPYSVKKYGEHYHHLINGVSTRDPTNHYAYENIAKTVSCKILSLTNDLTNAANDIDDLFKTILETKKPGYLYVPCDLVNIMIDSSNLNNISGSALTERIQSTSDSIIDSISNIIVEKIFTANNPVVLCDILTDRYGLTSEVQKIVDILKIPSCNSHMGKTLLNETKPWYIGDYNGLESNKMIQAYVQNSDCFLHFGDYYNEINSGHWSLYNNIDSESIVLLNPEYIKIGSKIYSDVSFEDIIPVILQKIQFSNQLPSFKIPNIVSEIEQIPSNTPISQTLMLEKFQSFFQPNDVIVTETCSLMFGLPDLKLPENSKIIGQHYYLSIGMALPCSFGVGVALKEMNKDSRLILIEGDGSAQMTIQELSNFSRENVVKPLVFLLNNNGYTVERIIKGPERDYNDIRPNWKWTELFKTFGIENSKTAKVITPEGLDDAMESFGKDTSVPRLIEVILDKMDVPWRFHKMVGN
jgi:phenylpyruvate decarboxylase